MDSLESQLGCQIVQPPQLLFVCLGGAPRREEESHPAFGLQRPHHLQRLFFMANLLQLLAACLGGEKFDDSLVLGVLVSNLGLGVQFPPQPGTIPGGANQQRGVLKKSIIRDQAQRPGLNIGCPVQGVHQQSIGSFVQRDRHGVDGKVPATQVVMDGSLMKDRFARLGKFVPVGADYVYANGSRKTYVKGAGGIVFAPRLATKFSNYFLEFKRISMHR